MKHRVQLDCSKGFKQILMTFCAGRGRKNKVIRFWWHLDYLWQLKILYRYVNWHHSS